MLWDLAPSQITFPSLPYHRPSRNVAITSLCTLFSTSVFSSLTEYETRRGPHCRVFKKTAWVSQCARCCHMTQSRPYSTNSISVHWIAGCRRSLPSWTVASKRKGSLYCCDSYLRRVFRVLLHGLQNLAGLLPLKLFFLKVSSLIWSSEYQSFCHSAVLLFILCTCPVTRWCDALLSFAAQCSAAQHGTTRHDTAQHNSKAQHSNRRSSKDQTLQTDTSNQRSSFCLLGTYCTPPGPLW